ncbi:uncharacterized protein BO97DRAFT_412519 [Aspergillus homomorphus CBS 101889]|uniref:Uncharacterized protein n=1 Tax=Aspergillus homomorphus (strain CBS 101889) TaxID=1450537 RepID=A0A395I3D7_ASPHC|nr:hypothetical protein BO97DRAFT_412519 [Aspergillus homomorphus CBS 101889]RAL14712.1 hypothetical protein BO97DRAFT_412519 [Aspergillus homomorphus CBS 101889]
MIAIQAADIEDLRRFDPRKFEGNPYQALFHDLESSTSSDGVSNEDGKENLARFALKSFVQIQTTVTRMRNSGAARFKFKFRGATHAAVNDWQNCVHFPRSDGWFDTKLRLSVVSLECKTRLAEGSRRNSGECFNPQQFAQEVADLIGAVLAQLRYPLPVKHADHETFVISQHTTILYISSAYLTADYIRYLRTGVLPGGDHNFSLWVPRSITFSLNVVHERGEGLGFLWALVQYLRSGSAKVNTIHV